MNTLQIGLILTILFYFLSGCDVLDDSPCGPKNTYDLYLTQSSPENMFAMNFHTYTKGSNRVLQWSQLVEHVCTEEHVNTEFGVDLFRSETAKEQNITARGIVFWQLFWEENVDLEPFTTNYKGKLEVGLKQAFSGKERSFIPISEIIFPTRGSYFADSVFIKQHIV